LSWVFFPQALRWSDQTSADAQDRDGTGRAGGMRIHHDPVRRDLALIGPVLTLVLPPAVATALQRMGVSIVWFGAVFGVVGIVAVLRLPDDLLPALPTWSSGHVARSDGDRGGRE